MQKHGLDHLNAAQAGMIVSSVVFQYHITQVKDIDPFVATGIVAMGVVEGAKTAPQPLGAGSSQGAKKENRNDERLLLGEQDEVMREAAANGGVHIILNPEVLKTLQQGGIDPYLIHEQGLKNKSRKRFPESISLMQMWKRCSTSGMENRSIRRPFTSD
ncbi:MAG TPA: hypothetical protein VLA72_06570 [Anaerolineales bacterium]|nr:hypothetical protein [Anaerolineales bacterium]